MRETYTVRLVRNRLLSAASECYHLTFSFAEEPAPSVLPGQFLSFLAEDASGKTYTRAYSIASDGTRAAAGFDLCLNRVPGGFFSNLLCDLSEGQTVRCHGPHGMFTLREPLAESLWVAAGTGIAPMRGFAQALFGDGVVDRETVGDVYLVHQADEHGVLLYQDEFAALAEQHPAFHYVPVLENDEASLSAELTRVTGRLMPGDGPHASLAYVCGLAEMVKPARAHLLSLGWEKRQVLFERYD